MEPLWIECQDCAGSSGAFLRSSGPTVDELILQMISLQYHETLMAAAGFQAEQLKEQAAKAFRGRYLLVIEGAIPLGLGGAMGPSGLRRRRSWRRSRSWPPERVR